MIAWGRALRLAQRLSGGTETLLRKTSIGLASGRVVLSMPTKYRELYSDAVERRLTQLAKALGQSKKAFREGIEESEKEAPKPLEK